MGIFLQINMPFYTKETTSEVGSKSTRTIVHKYANCLSGKILQWKVIMIKEYTHTSLYTFVVSLQRHNFISVIHIFTLQLRILKNIQFFIYEKHCCSLGRKLERQMSNMVEVFL